MISVSQERRVFFIVTGSGKSWTTIKPIAEKIIIQGATEKI